MRLARLLTTAVLLVLPAPLVAQSLTLAQLQTLKTDIAGNTTAVPSGLPECANLVGLAVNALPNATDPNACIAAVYNLANSPAFTVWKTKVPKVTVGETFNAAELAGLTSLNTQRLQNLAAWLDTINPSLLTVRTFFDDVFSGAGGTNTRAALLILWKRLASRFERLYATGTGSDPSPATLVVEGTLSGATVGNARNLP